MKKLSFIIPVYNVAGYIERCLNSVTQQNISLEEYEIIVINDGSTDNSLNIINEFAQKFSNIRVHSQQNQGLGAARNKGLKVAQGSYVWFLDSDDFISEDCLDQLLSFAIEKNTDVLSFDFNCTNENGDKINWINFSLNYNNKKSLTGEEFYFNNYKYSYIWLYLFKRSLFIENDIYFKERINMQDSEIMPKILFHVKKILHYNKVAYFYVNRDSSFINTKNPSTRKRYYFSIISVYLHLERYKDTMVKDSFLKKGIQKKLEDINKILFQQFIYNDFEDIDLMEIISNLKKNNLLPFKYICEQDFKRKFIYNTLRIFVNFAPLTARRYYLMIK